MIDPIEGSQAQWPGQEDLQSGDRCRTDTERPTGARFHADIAEAVHTRLKNETTMLVVKWCTPR
ncbi:hypothetical protein ACQEVF_47595 [Nonomuraea polychroma]|uniref:hypothetical protein n=1 Tax=Nonomuraea polychroma TaxID=46176 RepID=UPI003D94364D